MKKLIVFISLIFLSCKAPSVKIGVIIPLEGPASIYGKNALNGINIFCEEKKGEKFFGRNFVILIKDNKGSPAKTKEIITALAEDKEVLCVVGPLISKNVFVAASVSQKYILPLISPTATHPLVTKMSDFIFRTTFTDSIQGYLLAKFIYKELKKKKVAILYEANDPYSEVLSRNFEISFKNFGGEILTSEYFFENDTIFYSKIDKISSFNPEVLFLPVYANFVPHILKECLELKFNPIFVGGDGWYSYELINKNKEIFENVKAYISSPFTTFLPNEKTREFIRKYKEKYKSEPEFTSALCYDALEIVYEVLKRMEKPDRMEFLNNLKEIEYQGVTGSISFKRGKDPLRDVFILEVSPEGFKYVLTMKPE